MRPLVIVRPQPAAEATAAAARALGLEPVVMPLFEVMPVEWTAPDAAGFEALLLTSANAIRHGGSQLDRLRALPAHCVGEATATAARDAGFGLALVGASNLEALLEEIPPESRLLHLCGVHRRSAEDSRQEIVQVVVYESRQLPLPEGIAGIDGAVVAVHSPRAAARLAAAADEAGVRRAGISIAAISEAAAAAAGEGWERVGSVSEPTDSALLALAAALCNNSG